MTQPTVTTGGPAPAGVYWQALIYAAVTLLIEPDISPALIPKTGFDLITTPHIGVQPPVLVSLIATPAIIMAASTTEPASFMVETTPNISVGNIPSASFKLSVTPSMTFTARAKNPAHVYYRPSVTRAATI